MTNYTNKIFGSIMIQRVADFDDYCQYRPNRVKRIGTADGEIRYVCKTITRNRMRYWLWLCVACKRTGIVRADTLSKWTENGHQCRCQCKQHKDYGAYKLCKFRQHKLPATTAFFYRTKAGYLSTNCRACSRVIAEGKRDTIPKRAIGYDRNMEAR